MKKPFYLVGLAALALVGCSDNDLLSGVSNVFSDSKEEITFSSGTSKPTRAGETSYHSKAAEKLNNHFLLYGFKYNTEESLETPAGTGTGDELVFDHYNLFYQDGTENTTESNTAGWEYVGYQTSPISPATSADQSIKYWDHSATGYVFSGISSLDATATKMPLTSTPMTDKYQKGWNVVIPAGGTLTNLYASDRVEKLLASDYDREVMLTFYSMVAKVRFAFYEIVPGYKIHIDKFYYGTTNTTETNFAIDGNFKTLKADGTTELKVTYYSDTETDGLENRPKIAVTAADDATSMVFGTNIQATPAIGTASNTATYDQADGEYTCILPFNGGTNTLNLKVDYTLTSIDGSQETIVVKGATAVVPEIYTNWKENFAYTYLFKISDNTNGYTGNDGVRGLYPITFDACVVNEEDGIQETITSISEPSITTYEKGEIVTKNDEYEPGNIYYTVMLNGSSQALNVNTQVYEVNNYGTETLTENVVENWKNNYCVLTQVTPTKATAIPMKNGANLTPGEEKAYFFDAKAGKNYVIQYNVPADIPYADLADYKAITGNTGATAIPDGQYKVKAGDYYKLVRVVGTATAPTYTLTATAGQKITTQSGIVTYTVKSNSPSTDLPVLGAGDIFQIKTGSNDVTAKFDITDNSDGTYTIKATADAIKEGLDADYTVAVVKKDGTNAVLDDADNGFNVDMTISANEATVVAKNKTTVTPLVGGATVTGATIVNGITGLTVKESGTPGTYDVIADNSITVGPHDITIAGQTVTITAKSYKFTPNAITLTWAEGATAPTATSVLNNGTADESLANISDIQNSQSSVATISQSGSAAAGTYTITAAAGGKTQLTYENAVLNVTVNEYALGADKNTITARTGSAKLTFTLNNVAQVVKSGSIKVYKDSGSGPTLITTGFSLTNTGKGFTFGNVIEAGTYRFDYVDADGTTVLGTETITVTAL